jgi:hypothetical protein
MQAKEQAAEVVKLLTDQNSNVRYSAVGALGAMQAKEQAAEVVKLLTDPNPSVQDTTRRLLIDLAPLPSTIFPDVAGAYYFNHTTQEEIRFVSYYVFGGDPSVALLLRRIMFEADQKPAPFDSVEQARATLSAFQKFLPAKQVNLGFASDSEQQILQIARMENKLDS